ncbi:hypothetical protein H2200_004784 [Cladophialophora chaetospira]|uniref:Nucleoporin NUP37 n=1 Tax=Cladophialophora chaetospira TaxID=386627 RepID=A0AA39CKH5_9EURO|nr:hypothetical protein H2200_004784 [Cladophialophora chaetospira]
MNRSVLKQKERIQLSYDLPHEAYRSHVYPRQSSNGSTVVIYGHEQGLRLVWYAGKGFKSKKNAPAPKVNGTSKSGPMVIDLDDDEEDDEPNPTAIPAPPAEFEEDEAEIDPHAPYRDVTRFVDIPLGTAALRLAVPNIPRDLAHTPPGAFPTIYSDRIVVAAACSDLTLRLVSAPLDPPGPDVLDVSKMDIQMVKIEGTDSHQQFVSDIAITHTGTPLDELENLEDQTQSKPQTRTQSQPKEDNKDAGSVQWSLLVASISCTGAGLLLVHQIPLRSNQISPNAESAVPIRRTYLRTSSMSAKLSFNTSAHPAERHSTLLVTLPSEATVKVYQVFQSQIPRERRGSNATDSSVSTTRSTRILGNDRGKFLITLLPPFSQEEKGIVMRRKRVLDAKWIAGGRAIMTLLGDGEWGIWDLEAVGPTSSSSGANLLRGQGNISGVQGGSLTRFAVRSNISPYVETKQKTSIAQAQPSSGSLMPMTPSTRKVRSEGLFHGSKLNTDVSSQNVQQHGTIYIEERSSNLQSHEESVIISYAGENIYLPSILSFWKGETKPIRLPLVKLGGQEPRSVGLLPPSNSSDHALPGTSTFDFTPSTPDFLVQTSHRIIFSLTPLSSQSSTADVSSQTGAVPSDQALLVSGVLDVEGMDRMLDDMGGVDDLKKPKNLFNRSVGFRIGDEDGDGDVDMTASPTPARGSLKLTNGRSGFGGETPVPRRRIFT